MIRDVDKELAEYNDLGVDYGVLVDPQPGGPSAKAGMKRYDIIIQIDGEKITNRFDLQDVVFKKEVGDTISVVVVRNGEKLELSVKLGELAR